MRPERVELVTGPLAFLGWAGFVAVIAQSVPPIPSDWRLPIAIGCAGAVLLHVAVGLWLDVQTSAELARRERRDDEGSDDES